MPLRRHPNAPPAHPLPRQLSAAELMTAELPDREPILDPILSAKSLALLYGPRGMGKTFVALSIAWAAASGTGFLGWRAHRRHRVLYIDGEMPAEDMQKRLRMLGPAPDELRFMLADLDVGHFLPDLAEISSQFALVRAWGRQPDLLVIDNLSSVAGFERNDPDAWTNLQRFLMAMRKVGTAVLVVHHANKQGVQRGTSRREDVLDMVLAMRRPHGYAPSEGARFELHFEKARGLLGDTVEPLEVRMGLDPDGRIAWDWARAEETELRRVSALLREGLKPYQIARELGMSKARAYRLRNRIAGAEGPVSAP